MLSRKAPMFQYLEDWGCESVIRKNDIVVSFKEYDISVEDPRSRFRQQHKELSTEFVYQVLERTEYDSLIGAEDPGKQVFLDRISGTQ
ncbi:hypothetical protein BB347_01470 [Natronorubrum daqingense]|nr:hypothetical protein BB347_01470 [Natronorubrum daqingense]